MNDWIVLTYSQTFTLPLSVNLILTLKQLVDVVRSSHHVCFHQRLRVDFVTVVLVTYFGFTNVPEMNGINHQTRCSSDSFYSFISSCFRAWGTDTNAHEKMPTEDGGNKGWFYSFSCETVWSSDQADVLGSCIFVLLEQWRLWTHSPVSMKKCLHHSHNNNNIHVAVYIQDSSLYVCPQQRHKTNLSISHHPLFDSLRNPCTQAAYVPLLYHHD